MSALFYTGSYAHKGEAGILRIRADFEQGTWAVEMADRQAECPSYLLMHPNGKVLYAVRELTEEGGLYTFAVEGSSLRLISELPTHGKDPCYISLDDSGQFLFVVNYSGSSLSVFRLDAQGIPVELTDHVVHLGSGPNPIRQETAHPHCAVYRKGILSVCDLGMDRVFFYDLNRQTGTLHKTGSVSMPAGCGPRHLCFAKDIMYVVGELANKIYVLQLTGDTPHTIQEISTLHADFRGKNIAAAIKLSENGDTLFVSNRGDDSIAAFRVLPNGKLELANVCKTGGKTPRDFSVFGDYLVVANQDSDSITVLRFDKIQHKLAVDKVAAYAVRPTQILKF